MKSKKQKSLNNSYNFDYNNSLNTWIIDLQKRLDRKKSEITFHPHTFDKEKYLNLDLNKIEETVRTGRIFKNKCAKPNKLCFKRYYGKENITYTVIVRYYKNFIEVRTAWTKKGR